MILCIGAVLDETQIAGLRRRLEGQAFIDGAATAGWHAKLVKHNRQAGAGPETGVLQAEVGAVLARQLKPSAPPETLQSALASCRLFVEHPIARMTGICALIRRATGR